MWVKLGNIGVAGDVAPKLRLCSRRQVRYGRRRAGAEERWEEEEGDSSTASVAGTQSRQHGSMELGSAGGTPGRPEVWWGRGGRCISLLNRQQHSVAIGLPGASRWHNGKADRCQSKTACISRWRPCTRHLSNQLSHGYVQRNHLFRSQLCCRLDHHFATFGTAEHCVVPVDIHEDVNRFQLRYTCTCMRRTATAVRAVAQKFFRVLLLSIQLSPLKIRKFTYGLIKCLQVAGYDRLGGALPGNAVEDCRLWLVQRSCLTSFMQLASCSRGVSEDLTPDTSNGQRTKLHSGT